MIGEYIARDRPMAASRIVEHILESVDNLSTHPFLGRPGRLPGTRELVVAGTPFIVPYQVREDEVVILRVFHAARKWPDSF
jgi:toxin ParE1/3/4